MNESESETLKTSETKGKQLFICKQCFFFKQWSVRVSGFRSNLCSGENTSTKITEEKKCCDITEMSHHCSNHVIYPCLLYTSPVEGKFFKNIYY